LVEIGLVDPEITGWEVGP